MSYTAILWSAFKLNFRFDEYSDENCGFIQDTVVLELGLSAITVVYVKMCEAIRKRLTNWYVLTDSLLKCFGVKCIQVVTKL